MTTKLIVHCGRGKRDWLVINTRPDKTQWFNGFGFKKNATRFVSVAQAEGAIKMHCIQQRISTTRIKHKIFRVEEK